jgi:hypothetical protein
VAKIGRSGDFVRIGRPVEGAGDSIGLVEEVLDGGPAMVLARGSD